MTKTEFKREAAKAGIQPELYGAVLAGQLYSHSGPVSGGKVVGIEWRDAWKTEREYSYIMGEQKKTFLSKAPYVILIKNKVKYQVEAHAVKLYVDKQLGKWLDEKVKANEPI